MSSEPNAPAKPTLKDRLHSVQVGVREDLEVTRHLFRGDPVYVICDPLTFQSHRFDPAEYAVLASINPEKSLSETFDDLVKREVMDPESEESFYQFIFSLHRFNFLNLPISDDKLLYERHSARKRAERRRRIVGILFLRVPLVTPDAFLERTIRYVRPIFSRAFFCLWTVMVCAALYIAAKNWGQLLNPAEGFLLARNIPLLWCVLIVLKLFHELGHAYACKHYGGYVPEMGAFFIVFTPCAYVDASAAWSFTRARDRIVVCLAGMYVESIFAALAMFVWVSSPPGVLRDVSYNVIFLAGVVTVLFNINPLMRYDGYYVFSDLVEVPNLRQRSKQYVLHLLKRLTLGVRDNAKPATGRLAVLLACFGTAAMVYRVLVTIGIAALLASKMFLVGLGFGLFMAGQTVVRTARQLFGYLWFAKETAPVRLRAVAVSALLIVLMPSVLLLVPIRSRVVVTGVVRGERETLLRVRTAGVLNEVAVQEGDVVDAGDLIVELRDPETADAVLAARTRVNVSDIRLQAYEVENPSKARQERDLSAVYRMELDRWTRDLAALDVRSEDTGTVIQCVDERELGRYVAVGDPVATIMHGRWEVRAVLEEAEIAEAKPRVGDEITVRSLAAPGRVMRGRVTRVAPKGSRNVQSRSLTLAGGGDIPIDPKTGRANHPYFELTVLLEEAPPPGLKHGMTCRVRLSGEPTPLGMSLLRRTIRFTNALLQG